MTVSTPDNRAQYATNGTTGPWTVPFYFLQDEHLQVIYTTSAGVATTLALDADYGVSGAGDPDGGTITTELAYAVGGTITILRDLDVTQETDYVETDAFPAASHERALDKLTMIVQQVYEVLSRALVFSASDTNVEPLPPATARALRTLGFDASGNITLNAPSDGTSTSLALLLASYLNATQGAGMIGLAALNYANGTIGYKLRRFILASDYATSADGSTDDSTKLLQAATDAVALGLPLHLDGAKTYGVGLNGITFPAGLRLFTHGATIRNTANHTGNVTWLEFGESTEIDTLKIELQTGIRRDRLVRFQGANVSIGTISVVSADQQENSESNDGAVVFLDCTGLRVRRVIVSNYDRAVTVTGCARAEIGGLDIRSYVRGLYINDTENLRIGASKIYEASPNAGILAGHDGVLISSQTTGVTKNITLEDFDVLDAGEHGVRIGGLAITNINITRFHIKGHGGCGIKILGTDVGAPSDLNETIVIESAVIEDGGTSTPAAKNRCGVLVLYSVNVQISNLTVRAKNQTWAASYGILVSSSSDVMISSPNISTCQLDGIMIDASFDSCSRVQVHGGLSQMCGGSGLALSAETNILRRITVDGLVCDGNTTYGLNIDTASGGSFVDSLVRSKVYGNTAGAAVCTSNAVGLDVTGLVGSTPLSGISALNGSKWSDNGTLNIRKSGAWTAL